MARARLRPRLHRPGAGDDVAARRSPGARVVPDMDDAFFNIWRLSWVAHQLVHQPDGPVRRQHLLPCQAHARLLRCDAAGRAGRRPVPVGRRAAGGGPQRSADRRLRHLGLGDGRAGVAPDRRSRRGVPRRGDRRLRAVPLRPYRPPGAAVAGVDAAGPAGAARAGRAAAAPGRPGARRLPGRRSCCAASTTASSWRSSSPSPGSRLVVAHGAGRDWSRRRPRRPSRWRWSPSPTCARTPPADPRMRPRTADEVAGYSATPGRLPARAAITTSCAGGRTAGRRRRSGRCIPGPRRSAWRCSACGGRGRARPGSTPAWPSSPSMPRWACTASPSACCRRSRRPSATCARRPASPASAWWRWPRWPPTAIAAVGAPARCAPPSRRQPSPCASSKGGRGRPLRDARLEPMLVDRWLATLPDDTVILELPVPDVQRLWGYETSHQVRSIHHWRHLVNGYSGFLPTAYGNTLVDMATFPDERVDRPAAPPVGRLPGRPPPQLHLRRRLRAGHCAAARRPRLRQPAGPRQRASTRPSSSRSARNPDVPGDRAWPFV